MNTSDRFRAEDQLVRMGRRIIRESLREIEANASIRYEVRVPGGIPDLVLFSKSMDQIRYVVIVEFKLSDWRRGLHQSFKSLNYGNETYLVLDTAHVRTALEHYELFRRANVGLLSLAQDRSLQVWHYPNPQLPFSMEFSRVLARSLLGPRRTIPERLSFTRSTRGGAGLSELRNLWGAVKASHAF